MRLGLFVAAALMACICIGAVQAQSPASARMYDDVNVAVKAELNYPAAELKADIGGAVCVAVTLDGDGRVLDLKIVSSSGNRNLDRAALDAAARSTYRKLADRPNPAPRIVELYFGFSPPLSAVTDRGKVVVIAVDLDGTGKVLAAHVSKSSRNPSLDRAALDAATRTKFFPQIRNGVGVPVRAYVDYDFVPDADPSESKAP